MGKERENSPSTGESHISAFRPTQQAAQREMGAALFEEWKRQVQITRARAAAEPELRLRMGRVKANPGDEKRPRTGVHSWWQQPGQSLMGLLQESQENPSKSVKRIQSPYSCFLYLTASHKSSF